MRTSSTSSSSWSAKSAGCLSVRLQENNHLFELAQTLLLCHQPGAVSVRSSVCLSICKQTLPLWCVPGSVTDKHSDEQAGMQAACKTAGEKEEGLDEVCYTSAFDVQVMQMRLCRILHPDLSLLHQPSLQAACLPACPSECLSVTLPGTPYTHSVFQSTKSAACPECPRQHFACSSNPCVSRS